MNHRLLLSPIGQTPIRLLDECSLDGGYPLVDLVDLRMAHGLAVTVKRKADVDCVDTIQLRCGEGERSEGNGDWAMKTKVLVQKLKKPSGSMGTP